MSSSTTTGHAGSPATTPRPLTPRLMALLTLTMFACSGTIHFQTPMLTSIGAEFGAGAAATGWIATLSFAGFLAGTVFLVPLGDRYDKRHLFLAQFALTIVAILAMAAAPSLTVLAAASFVAGIGCSSSSQNVIPMAAEMSSVNERGRIVGTLLTGLFLGILYARIAGGFVAAQLGWRWMYVISACTLLALAPLDRSPDSRAIASFALVAPWRYALTPLVVHFALEVGWPHAWQTPSSGPTDRRCRVRSRAWLAGAKALVRWSSM